MVLFILSGLESDSNFSRNYPLSLQNCSKARLPGPADTDDTISGVSCKKKGRIIDCAITEISHSALNKQTKNIFFRLVHWNCLIFGSKVNLGNSYTLQVLKVFDQFFNPL